MSIFHFFPLPNHTQKEKLTKKKEIFHFHFCFGYIMSKLESYRTASLGVWCHFVIHPFTIYYVNRDNV